MIWKHWVGVIIPLIVLVMPAEMLPFAGLTVTEHRLLAIFIFAILFWVMEPIPVFATSVVIIMLQLLLISNKGPVWWVTPPAGGAGAFGTLVDYKLLLGSFASPVIMLFMGGFFLAMAATKYRLDVNLARVLLRPFGSDPKMVMLGMMGVTAVFSMFMSNTATTAMMLAVLMPIFKKLEDGDRGRIAYLLAIPFAANIGGIGTPIGTPPNAVAQNFLRDGLAVDFGTWMLFSVPYALLMLLVTWFLLCRLFPISTPKIEIRMQGKWLKTGKALSVYFVFAATILLWLTGKVHGMSSHVVAMIPVTVFVASGIIIADDLNRISWDVLWLVAGGIALGIGLSATGLSSSMVSAVPFDQMSPVLTAVAAALLALLMSTFISNTATANLLLPVIVAIGTSLSGSFGEGGRILLIVAVTYACSLAMGLPISTPPNALAHATGHIESRDMLKCGVTVGIIGLIVTFGMLFILHGINFLA